MLMGGKIDPTIRFYVVSSTVSGFTVPETVKMNVHVRTDVTRIYYGSCLRISIFFAVVNPRTRVPNYNEVRISFAGTLHQVTTVR